MHAVTAWPLPGLKGGAAHILLGRIQLTRSLDDAVLDDGSVDEGGEHHAIPAGGAELQTAVAARGGIRGDLDIPAWPHKRHRSKPLTPDPHAASSCALDAA